MVISVDKTLNTVTVASLTNKEVKALNIAGLKQIERVLSNLIRTVQQEQQEQDTKTLLAAIPTLTDVKRDAMLDVVRTA